MLDGPTLPSTFSDGAHRRPLLATPAGGSLRLQYISPQPRLVQYELIELGGNKIRVLQHPKIVGIVVQAMGCNEAETSIQDCQRSSCWEISKEAGNEAKSLSHLLT